VSKGQAWRWGFLGASRIGRRALAPAILALPGHTLGAVAARDAARADSYAAEIGFSAALASYADLIAAPDIDLVYIALSNDAHLEWTIAALEAGKYVLCEKPLAMNAAEAADIARAEKRTGRRVMEAFCHVHHPQFFRARAAVAAEIGAIRTIDASFCATIGNPDDYRWLARHGGGALLDLGCYIVSYFRLLLDREPVRVAAVQRKQSDVDATLTGILDFGDGVCARFACSMEAAHGQHLEIVGETGRLTMDWPFSTKGRSTTMTVNAAAQKFAETDPYVAMVAHFVDRIADGGAFLLGADSSVSQAMALDALRAAAETGGWKTIPGPEQF
jgi:predicted dehydrogenase